MYSGRDQGLGVGNATKPKDLEPRPDSPCYNAVAWLVGDNRQTNPNQLIFIQSPHLLFFAT